MRTTPITAAELADTHGVNEALYSARQVASHATRELANYRATLAKAKSGTNGRVIDPPTESVIADAERKVAEATGIVAELEGLLHAQQAAQVEAEQAAADRAAEQLQAAEEAVIEAHRALDVAVLARLAAVDDPEAYSVAHAAAEAAKAALSRATQRRDQLAGGAR